MFLTSQTSHVPVVMMVRGCRLHADEAAPSRGQLVMTWQEVFLTYCNSKYLFSQLCSSRESRFVMPTEPVDLTSWFTLWESPADAPQSSAESQRSRKLQMKCLSHIAGKYSLPPRFLAPGCRLCNSLCRSVSALVKMNSL